jgi:hypothetical protein
MRRNLAPVQIDETRARESRSEVIAARTDAFEKAAPAFSGLIRESFGDICLVAIVHGLSSVLPA